MLTIWKNFSYNPSCIDFVMRFWLIPWLLLMVFFFLMIVLVSRNSGMCVNVRSNKNALLSRINYRSQTVWSVSNFRLVVVFH